MEIKNLSIFATINNQNVMVITKDVDPYIICNMIQTLQEKGALQVMKIDTLKEITIEELMSLE